MPSTTQTKATACRKIHSKCAAVSAGQATAVAAEAKAKAAITSINKATKAVCTILEYQSYQQVYVFWQAS